jgi:acetyltransferase-like isoleucine patch superfamily enzyme
MRGDLMGIGNFLRNLLIKVRELTLKRKLSNIDSHVSTNSLSLKINIFKEKGAVFNAKGNLRLLNFAVFNGPINIVLMKNATLQIDGDLMIAGGSKIFVQENGFLKIGGKEVEDDTCIINAIISVHKRVEIGKDCMITTDSIITDSNWHYVEYDGKPSQIQSDTIIGNHVWVCPGSNILKGAIVGDNCIIATKSLVNGGEYPENSLIAGMPAKVIRSNCKWKNVLY